LGSECNTFWWLKFFFCGLTLFSVVSSSVMGGAYHLKVIDLSSVALPFSPLYFSLLHGKMHYGPYFYCLFRCNPFNFDCLFLSFSLMLKFIICQFSPLIPICIYNIFSLVLLHLISYFVYFFFCQSFYAFTFIFQINFIILVFSIIIKISIWFFFF